MTKVVKATKEVPTSNLATIEQNYKLLRVAEEENIQAESSSV